MKYLFFKHQDDNYWFELNNNTCIRQITIKNSIIHLSCFEDCLAEGEVNINELEGEYQEITQKDFNETWNKFILPFQPQWEKIKNTHKIGSKIKGVCQYFYPQGIIIKGESYLAVSLNKTYIVAQPVETYVIGYNDENMWLIVE